MFVTAYFRTILNIYPFGPSISTKKPPNENIIAMKHSKIKIRNILTIVVLKQSYSANITKTPLTFLHCTASYALTGAFVRLLRIAEPEELAERYKRSAYVAWNPEPTDIYQGHAHQCYDEHVNAGGAEVAVLVFGLEPVEQSRHFPRNFLETYKWLRVRLLVGLCD